MAEAAVKNERARRTPDEDVKGIEDVWSGGPKSEDYIKILAKLTKLEEELSAQRTILQNLLELNQVQFRAMEKRFDSLQREIEMGFQAVFERFKAMDERFKAIDERFKAMDERFEALQREMDKRFEAMQREMDARFNAVFDRFKAIDERFDAVFERFKAIDERFEALDRRLTQITWIVGILVAAFSVAVSIISIMIP